MLVVSGLTKRHPNALRPIFRDLNFSVLAGQIVALVGESGVGKSTLLKPPDSFWLDDIAYCFVRGVRTGLRQWTGW